MEEKQSWSIVIFCFNEVETVAKVTQKVLDVLQTIADSYEILLVDDGSTDGSREEIIRVEKTSEKVRYIFHPENQGIGHALRTGYFNVKYENVCAVPADGQFDVTELLAFAQVTPGSFVSFFRKENTTYTLARNALSYANKVVNKWLLGFDIKDVNWVKIYKTEQIESEICAKLLIAGQKLIEVPSKYVPREAGVSKGASWKIVRQALRDTLLMSAVLGRFKRQLKR